MSFFVQILPRRGLKTNRLSPILSIFAAWRQLFWFCVSMEIVSRFCHSWAPQLIKMQASCKCSTLKKWIFSNFKHFCRSSAKSFGKFFCVSMEILFRFYHSWAPKLLKMQASCTAESEISLEISDMTTSKYPTFLY